MITTERAKEALKNLCTFTRTVGKDADLGCVKVLQEYIEQQEKKEPQVAALFKPLNMDS